MLELYNSGLLFADSSALQAVRDRFERFIEPIYRLCTWTSHSVYCDAQEAEV